MDNNNLTQKIQNFFTPPFTNRKIFLFSGAIIVILLFLIFWLVLTIHNASVSENAVQTPTQAPHAFPTKTQTYNPFPNGARYTMPSYTIEYPQDSQNTTNTFPEGTTLIIQPPNYPNEPVFDVEAYTTAQSLEQKQALYIASGATKSTLTVNGMSLPELSVTYQMRTINSQPIHTPTQLRLAYLVKPNSFYVFRMYYSSSTSVQADEDLFANFIKSFSLK